MMIARMNEPGYALADVFGVLRGFLDGRAPVAICMVRAPANSSYFMN